MLAVATRGYERIPGLSRAAKTLGISYGHARRVWLGEREAPKTLTKLRYLLRTPRAANQTKKPKS
jgi:hypothetical protein